MDSVITVPVGLDGFEAVLSDKNDLGPAELFSAFRSNLSESVSYEWFENHYRWIVWKLAKFEQTFPEKFGGSLLTPDELMNQIKYCYDQDL